MYSNKTTLVSIMVLKYSHRVSLNNTRTRSSNNTVRESTSSTVLDSWSSKVLFNTRLSSLYY